MATRFGRHLTTAVLATVAVTLAACSDSPVDPSATQASELKPEGAHLTIASTSVTTATLYPQYDNVYVSVEGHRIVIPAYSICQVDVSGYGPGYWNKPCNPQTAPITFTIATMVKSDGSSAVAVKPDVRFAPGKTVMAYLKDAKGATTPGAYIAYCALVQKEDQDFHCYDEGKYDPQMTTYRDPAQGIIYRRLKHFSGYNVVFGFGGGIEASMNVAPLRPNFLRSGYITTVGFDGGTDADLGSDVPRRR
jgi:hypothetical protein